jgi:hypothetical protein
MYLSMLFGVTMLAMVALGGLQLATSYAVAAERHAALRYADVALEQARLALVAQIAAQVEAGSPDGPFVAPSPTALAPVCSVPPAAPPAPCAFSASVSVTMLGQTRVSAPPNEFAQNVQRAEGVDENRVSATLSATVVSPGGSVVRRRSLIVRTYAAPPFASDDGSDEPAPGDIASGDSGGICDGSAICAGADTRIHVKFVCSYPSDPSLCIGIPDRYRDNFINESWRNGHAVVSPWSE